MTNEIIPVMLDWETRSRVDLKRTGGWVYTHDPNTEVVCGAAQFPDGSLHTWAPWPYTAPRGATQALSDVPPPHVVDACLRYGVAAHNAESFDRLVWEQLGLPEVRWFDSLPRARRRGLPGKLEQIAQLLYGEGKDKAGERLMRLCCFPQKGKLLDPAPLVLTGVVRYCVKDVVLLGRLWRDERLGLAHPDDPILALDTRINRRGVRADLEWLKELEWAASDYQRDAIQRAEKLGVSLRDLRSPKALRSWFAARGYDLPDAKGATMERLLGVEGEVGEVAEARLAVARVTLGKVAAARAWLVGGRLHGLFAYYAAHTGRWGGRGVQPQNLPRPPKGLGKRRPREGREWAIANRGSLAVVYGSQVRGVLVPDEGHLFAAYDFSQVEARGVLWLADDPGLDAFRKGDPYKPMAAKVYGIPVEQVDADQRALGKVLVLSMGYGGGINALLRGAEKSKLDLAATGIDPDAAVQTWRDAHPAVAGKRTGGSFLRGDGALIPQRRGGLWRRLYRTLKGCVLEGISSACAGIHFGREGKHMIVTLPSGRPMVYRNARSELRAPKWGGEPKPEIVWDSPKGPRSMWYGLLVENVTQAICRDLLCAAMRRVEDAGYRVALHVHDELVAQVPKENAEEHLARVGELMQQVPPWAATFPLAAEGALKERYGK